MNVERNNSKEPFIKKFKTRENYYIYDVNSNEILRVNEVIYNLIDDFCVNDIDSIIKKFKHLYKISEIKENYKTFKKAKKENNYLSNHRPVISFGRKSINDITHILNSNLQQLVLELTDMCNMRCKYCAFSGIYKYKRTHGSKSMPFEIAKKAVDFFIGRSRVNSDNKPSIGFYGGEPLLEFELIKKIISYLKNINKIEKYRISITTNGTRITKEIIEYFVKNKISITISLDGPKEIHNRYRVFANGGKTFNVIMKNLSNIREYSSEYFKYNISFNVLLAPPYNFEKIINFFYRNHLFKQSDELINFTSIDPYETTFFKDFGLEFHGEDLYKEMNKFMNRYKDARVKENDKHLTIEKKLFDKAFIRIDRREMKFLEKKYPPEGSCFPGRRRLFVNTDGKFFMCEKVNSNFEIGNVDYGFNYKKIFNFFEKYEEFFKDCRYCWALRLCYKCFDHIRKGSDFDEMRKKQLCIDNLYSIERNLIDYCEVREKNIDAFKALDSIKII